MFLLKLLSLLFVGDVRALDDKDFAVRHAAHTRLAGLDFLAVPALQAGRHVAGPEGQNRIDILLGRATTWADFGFRLGVTAVRDDDVPPDALRAFCQLATVWPAVASGIGREADRWTVYCSGGAEDWARRLNYRSGSLAGEFELVATWARQTRAEESIFFDGYPDPAGRRSMPPPTPVTLPPAIVPPMVLPPP